MTKAEQSIIMTVTSKMFTFYLFCFFMLLAVCACFPVALVGQSRQVSCRKADTATSFRAFTSSLLHMSSGKDDDLFDYFDPLLSPHAYPDGISPDKKPCQPDDKSTMERKAYSKKIGFTLQKTATQPQTQSSSSSESSNSQDLFEYFDPLLSPHAYPQGISPKKTTPQVEKKKGVSLLKKRVGILLMDHGSKKEASNARLHALADLYQSSIDEQYNYAIISERQVLVQAAHMELATPSIPDGLQKLKDAGVDEIICHPFFLSPDGRHVKEDIPKIIDHAIESLDIRIPVITTAPVGSNIQLMLSAVHALVVENSQILED
jgi:hypothetical protein